MTVKEIEEKTGLGRSNIRFYEKEGLISPRRNESNGYREYTQEDLDNIKKIACLRTLGISIGDIGKIMEHKLTLHAALREQAAALDGQIADLKTAKRICDAMLSRKDLSFEKLEVEEYVDNVKEHVRRGRNILKMDTAGFFYLWGGFTVWGVTAIGSLILAVVFVGALPDYIPVQWSRGMATTLVDKRYIFLYPAACVMIRFLLRPFIWRWVYKYLFFSDMISDYLTNFMCFTAVSVQVFTILFVKGLAEHVTTVLVLDAVVLLGLPAAGWLRMRLKGRSNRCDP